MKSHRYSSKKSSKKSETVIHNSVGSFQGENHNRSCNAQAHLNNHRAATLSIKRKLQKQGRAPSKCGTVSSNTSLGQEERTCFITGFSAEENQQELFQFLGQFSEHILKVSLPDKHPRSRYAFVIFDSVQNMNKFMELKVIKKGNRQLIIKNYTSGSKNSNIRNKTTRLFVHNLPLYWKDEDLKEVFEQYGQTNSAYIILDRTSGESRRFGYVEMTNPQDAISLARMGYLTHEGFQIKVKIHEKGTDKGRKQFSKHQSKSGRLFDQQKHSKSHYSFKSHQKSKKHNSNSRYQTSKSRQNAQNSTKSHNKRWQRESLDANFGKITHSGLNQAKKSNWSDSSSTYLKSRKTKNSKFTHHTNQLHLSSEPKNPYSKSRTEEIFNLHSTTSKYPRQATRRRPRPQAIEVTTVPANNQSYEHIPTPLPQFQKGRQAINRSQIDYFYDRSNEGEECLLDSEDEDEEIEEQTFQISSSKPSGESSGLNPFVNSKAGKLESQISLMGNFSIDNEPDEDNGMESYSLQYMEYFNSLQELDKAQEQKVQLVEPSSPYKLHRNLKSNPFSENPKKNTLLEAIASGRINNLPQEELPVPTKFKYYGGDSQMQSLLSIENLSLMKRNQQKEKGSQIYSMDYLPNEPSQKQSFFTAQDQPKFMESDQCNNLNDQQLRQNIPLGATKGYTINLNHPQPQQQQLDKHSPRSIELHHNFHNSFRNEPHPHHIPPTKSDYYSINQKRQQQMMLKNGFGSDNLRIVRGRRRFPRQNKSQSYNHF